MNLPTLYTRNKRGKTDYWEIRVEDCNSTVTIVTEYGLHGSNNNTSVAEEVTTGKNLGRSNETTPYEQACLEARSRWNKKKDKGYSEEIPTGKVNALGLPMPMLAKPYNPGMIPDGRWIYIQPKLDGHRCLAGWVDNEVKLWSRGGKFIDTLPHINESLSHTLPKHMILDGELYIHGLSLQELTSRIKRRQDASIAVRYHVYDQVADYQFERRFKDIECDSTEVLKVPTHFECISEIESFATRWILRGYEGIMVRLNDDTPYEAGYRSGSLLKVKGFEDREYEVLGIIRSNRGVPLLLCDGFSVIAPGTKEEKEAIFNNKDKYINQLVTVKYANLTKDGIPFHPVAIRFREDI